MTSASATNTPAFTRIRIVAVVTGMIALVVVGAQTMRHVYVRWIEPRHSVLDRFRDETEQEIMAAKDLSELVPLYAEAQKKVKEYEKEHPLTEQENAYARGQMEPYLSRDQLQGAIQNWEDHTRQLFELHVFWWFGLACVLVGAVSLWLVNPWFGWAFVILGYLEMQWATCPSFRNFGAQMEFDRLLTWKVIYSAAAMVLLVAAWLIGIARARKAT